MTAECQDVGCISGYTYALDESGLLGRDFCDELAHLENLPLRDPKDPEFLFQRGAMIWDFRKNKRRVYWGRIKLAPDEGTIPEAKKWRYLRIFSIFTKTDGRWVSTIQDWEQFHRSEGDYGDVAGAGAA